jgi:CRISPR-associated protein Cas1
MLLLDRAYSTTLLEDAVGGPDEWLMTRPSLGIGLPTNLAGRCALGNFPLVPADLLGSISALPVPDRGSRLVLAAADLPSLTAAAALELRQAGISSTESLGRIAGALRRSAHPCRTIAGADHTAFEDDDVALVLAALCRTIDIPGTPLRHRVDVCREYLATEDFTGRRTAVRRLRRWMERRGSSATRRPGGDSAMMTRITSDASLYRAFERVRDNARASDRVSREVDRFEASLSDNLRRIGAALQAGRWRPAPPRRVRIAKQDGSERQLHIPPVGDRVVERAIASAVSEMVDQRLSPWSFAFRPGRGVQDAVRALVAIRDEGATHVARFDIADAFGSIDHGRRMVAFDRFIDDDWARELVAVIVARDLPGIDRSQRLVGIAQGSPLSPLLCNLILDELDDGLLRAGLPAVRYADDLALPAGGAAEANEALRIAEDLCDGLGFTINDAKTSVAAFADVVEFLGEPISASSPPSDAGLDDAPPRRRTLYLTSRTANVHLRQGQVRSVARDGSLIASVPVSGVGRLVVVGPMNVSAGLRSHALLHDIDVVFLSRTGSWLGRYDSGRSGDVLCRIAQYRLSDDEQRRLALARGFVRGKVANQRALLQRYVRRRGAAALASAIDDLEQSLVAVDSAESRSALMGCEGNAARTYLTAFARLLPDGAGFNGRNRRPPKDPVNAALSFGYTLLTGEAHAACATTGLDAAVGILHDLRSSRPSLALDLVEEFRPMIVDSVVLSLFRRGRLDEAHFRRGDGAAVLLNDAGRRVLIDAYETRMLTRVHSTTRGQRVTYRDMMRDQASALRRIITEGRHEYSAVGWR